MSVCELHRSHSPEPLVLHRHHVIPESWTRKAGLPEGRLVSICPTVHENVHAILNRVLIMHEPLPPMGPLTRAIVVEALEWYALHPVPRPMTSPLRR